MKEKLREVFSIPRTDINPVITLRDKPIKNSEQVFVNGLLLWSKGDYKVKNNEIQFKYKCEYGCDGQNRIQVFYDYEV